MGLIALLIMGCGEGAGSDTTARAADTADIEDTAGNACIEYSVAFEEGPDQLPSCLKDIVSELGSLGMGKQLDDANDAAKGTDYAIAVAVNGALNGQLARYLESTFTLSDAQAVYEKTCDLLEPELVPLSRVGKKPEEICAGADTWAAKSGLDAMFNCTEVTLSHSMTGVLEELFGAKVEGFWMHMAPASATDPNLLWMPMFLAMQHGATPGVLFYEASTGSDYAAILELGMEVHGPEASVKAFWDFVAGSFEPSSYSSGTLAKHISGLDIVLPSRVTWRDADGALSSWVLGDTSPPPFSNMFKSAGIIDPCAPLYGSDEVPSAGGVDGQCENSLERMIAVSNELDGHITYFNGTAASTCDRYALDLSL